MANINYVAIKSGLKFQNQLQLNKSKYYIDIPNNIFGVFVSVERSKYHSLNTYPENIHGCIGYWDPNYNVLEKDIIFNKIDDVAYKSTWVDSRRKYFKHSIYIDIYAQFKIYFMSSPIFEINKNGLIESENIKFDNNIYGLIVDDKKGFRATYLPQVFKNISWENIRKSLVDKAGILESKNKIYFYAYKCKIKSIPVIDYYFIPILEFINNNYGSFIPYIIDNLKISIDKSQDVRNIATIYDILRLNDYGYLINSNIKQKMKNNLDFYKDKKNSQSWAFLLLALDYYGDQFVKDIYDYLNSELIKNYESIDKIFELYEILYAITKYSKKYNKENVIIEEEFRKLNNFKSNNIFQLNWISKFVQQYMKIDIYRKSDLKKDITICENILQQIIKYFNENIDNKYNNVETNYLAVTFEGLTSLYEYNNNNNNNNTNDQTNININIVDNDVNLDKIIEKLIINLERRRDKFGLYSFNDGISRLDITGHVLNGFYNLVDISLGKGIEKNTQYGGAKTYFYKYMKYKQKYIKFKY